MHILIAIGIALALLYWWLRGHWFARIIVLIVLVPTLSLGLAVLNSDNAPYSLVVSAVLGVLFAWPIASLPTYYHRYQARLDAEHQAAMRAYLLSNAPVGSLARPTRGGVSFLR